MSNDSENINLEILNGSYTVDLFADQWSHVVKQRSVDLVDRIWHNTSSRTRPNIDTLSNWPRMLFETGRNLSRTCSSRSPVRNSTANKPLGMFQIPWPSRSHDSSRSKHMWRCTGFHPDPHRCIRCSRMDSIDDIHRTLLVAWGLDDTRWHMFQSDRRRIHLRSGSQFLGCARSGNHRLIRNNTRRHKLLRRNRNTGMSWNW